VRWSATLAIQKIEQTQTLPHSLYLSLYKPFTENEDGGGSGKILAIKREKQLTVKRKERESKAK
jgi:hypothetical protein